MAHFFNGFIGSLVCNLCVYIYIIYIYILYIYTHYTHTGMDKKYWDWIYKFFDFLNGDVCPAEHVDIKSYDDWINLVPVSIFSDF